MSDTLPVNEIFQTIQGEARFTGTPAVFVRLMGCDVGCAFCDTKHTWFVAPDLAIAPAEMLGKVEDAPTYATFSAAELVDLVTRYQAKHVVLTGGEPCAHDLRALTGALCDAGRTVQIETSGTYPILVDHRAWVTLSPKIGMPGGRDIYETAFARADEIKVPVGKPADIEKMVPWLGHARASVDVWLQPLSTSKKATELCIASATANGWRLSIQTHKFIGVR
jgi:7-carboxy-7-deazaguanine synthase